MCLDLITSKPGFTGYRFEHCAPITDPLQDSRRATCYVQMLSSKMLAEMLTMILECPWRSLETFVTLKWQTGKHFLVALGKWLWGSKSQLNSSSEEPSVNLHRRRIEKTGGELRLTVPQVWTTLNSSGQQPIDRPHYVICLYFKYRGQSRIQNKQIFDRKKLCFRMNFNLLLGKKNKFILSVSGFKTNRTVVKRILPIIHQCRKFWLMLYTELELG